MLSVFNILRSKVVLDLYTWRQEVYDTAQPSSSNTFYPDWWRGLKKTETVPGSIHPIPTIKGCAGLIDQYRSGIIVPMWADCNIETSPLNSPDFRWAYSDNVSEAVPHPGWQRGSFLPEREFSHLKLVSPWLGFSTSDIKWQLLQCIWNTENPHDVIIPPGILEFKHQHAINVNAFFRKTDTVRVHSLAFGSPAIQLLPITEREVSVRCHVVSREEWQRRNAAARSISFSGTYKKYKDAAAKREQRKCPFSGLGK